MLLAFGYLSAFVSILAFPPYLRDVFKGGTKPERASWFIWTLLGAISFFSQRAEGATHSLWLVSAQSLGVSIVFLISLWKGVGGFLKRDIASLVVATLGLVLWYLTRHAIIALGAAILVDAAGVMPTIIKSYEDPGSETMITWVLCGIGGIFGALAVGNLSLVLLAYPVYIFLANFAVVAAILLGRRRILV